MRCRGQVGVRENTPHLGQGSHILPDVEEPTKSFYDRVSMWSCTTEDVDASSLSLSGDTEGR